MWLNEIQTKLNLRSCWQAQLLACDFRAHSMALQGPLGFTVFRLRSAHHVHIASCCSCLSVGFAPFPALPLVSTLWQIQGPVVSSMMVPRWLLLTGLLWLRVALGFSFFWAPPPMLTFVDEFNLNFFFRRIKFK